VHVTTKYWNKSAYYRYKGKFIKMRKILRYEGLQMTNVCVEGKVKLSLCLIKCHAMKTYGEVDV
jgi:hypothetical protein